MRRLTTMVMVLLCAVMVSAESTWIKVTVDDYGQLEAKAGVSLREIDSLVVEGPIDSVDMKVMWDGAYYGRLRVLNLEGATLKNNMVPIDALFNGKVQQWHPSWRHPYFRPSEEDYLPLKRLMLPNSVESIGKLAFVQVKLEALDLPASVKTIGACAFSGCVALKDIVIPDGVTTVTRHCFEDCGALERVKLPATITAIEEYAFNGCRSLVEIELPDDCLIGGSTQNDGGFEFYGCSSLTEITIPSVTKYIPKYCFNGCANLRKITYDSNIKGIGTAAFQGCASLEAITIPKEMTLLSMQTFDGCKSLKEIEIHEGITYIGDWCFKGTSLETVTLPKTLRRISEDAFGDISTLKSVRSYCLAPPVHEQQIYNTVDRDFTAFGGTTSKDIPIYVPVGAADAYRAAFGWNWMTNYIEDPLLGNTASIDETVGEESSMVEVYDLSGRRIDVGSGLEQLPRGIYVVRRGLKIEKVQF